MNLHLYVYRECNIYPAEIAKIHLKEKYVLVENGKKAVLECKADGIPPPVITWLGKDGKKVRPQD